MTPEIFTSKVHECISALSKKRAYLARMAVANAEISEAQKAFDKISVRLSELLLKTAPDALLSLENANAEYARIGDFLSEYEEMKSEEDALGRTILTEQSDLASYDEQQLRGEVNVDISEVTPEAIFEAERSKRALVARKDAFERRINMLNNEFINEKAIHTELWSRTYKNIELIFLKDKRNYSVNRFRIKNYQ